MNTSRYILILFSLIVLLFGSSSVQAQEPDLSKVSGKEEKIKAWMAYCESLRIAKAGVKNNFPALQQAALTGIAITPATDAPNRARFYFFAAFACYYQVKFDSAQYYFYQSLYEAQKAKNAEFIAEACVALIPANFQLQQQEKVDSCKNILQSILDTTKNENILRDGYSAMGNYYQQKAYYSTAEDFFIRSIEFRKKQVDTTSNIKLKADYAILCYQLSKLYLNTDVLSKGLNILKEGQPFANYSPPVHIRYLSSFTEIYSLLGNIDSALFYQRQLEEQTKNSPVVLSEMVSANLNIAKFYIEHGTTAKALPYITKADTLAARSKSPLLIYQAQLWKGRWLEETGKFDQAVSFLAQSMPVAKQISKEQYAEALKFMALAQKGAGNLKESIRYFEEYIQQSDSLNKEKISRNLADQETRYETHQKEQRIELLSGENRLDILELSNASRTRLILILGLISLGIIALLLYFIYRNKEKLNKVLNERNSQLDELNHELAIANDTKAKLFGIIGHDMRAPVSQIVQLLQLQKEKPDLLSGGARTRHEEKLKTASENVLETMEDLLLWSKSQMQSFKPRFVPVNMTDIIQKELSQSQQRMEDRNIMIDNEMPENFIQKTDENFVTVIIRNLLQNAIRYSDENSTISIATNRQKIFITNQASQTNAASLNALLDSNQVDSKTTGLGLQIALGLAHSILANVYFMPLENNKLSVVLSWEK
jgi:signal transduction histidine kinase